MSLSNLKKWPQFRLLEPEFITNIHLAFVYEKVVCGSDHTLALGDEGALYAWGGNSYGQLGLGHATNAHCPVKVSVAGMGRVYDTAASHTYQFSVAMDHENCVYIWGRCRGSKIMKPVLTGLTSPHDAFAFHATNVFDYQSLLLYAEQDTSILGYLKNAFNDADVQFGSNVVSQSTSDLVIEVQEKPIHVHKSVLKIRSQHFSAMYQEHWAEDSQSILKLDQFSYAVYKSFLRYLYTDEVDLSVENAFGTKFCHLCTTLIPHRMIPHTELLDLANFYCEIQLKIRCVEMIKRRITVENAARLYVTAIENNAKELEEFCFKFAVNHMTAFVQTTNFANLDESTRNTFIAKAAQAGVFKN